MKGDRKDILDVSEVRMPVAEAERRRRWIVGLIFPRLWRTFVPKG